MMPPAVVQIRRSLCKCEGVNHEDPCAACPLGHFPPYVRVGCESIGTATAAISPSHPPDELKGHRLTRPGDLLAELIYRATGIQQGSCACAARQALMNQGGWWWCWRNRATIIGWLVEEAGKRNVALDSATALGLFKAALRQARA